MFNGRFDSSCRRRILRFCRGPARASDPVERFKFQVSVALTLMLSASRDLSMQRVDLSSWLELLWNSSQAASREELVSLCRVISCFKKLKN